MSPVPSSTAKQTFRRTLRFLLTAAAACTMAFTSSMPGIPRFGFFRLETKRKGRPDLTTYWAEGDSPRQLNGNYRSLAVLSLHTEHHSSHWDQDTVKRPICGVLRVYT